LYPGKEENLEKAGEPKIQFPGIETVSNFFEQNKSPDDNARKFDTHYHSSGWKTGDMKTIVSWLALARKWIENNQNNRTDTQTFRKRVQLDSRNPACPKRPFLSPNTC
jgi:hypothetical protein